MRKPYIPRLERDLREQDTPARQAPELDPLQELMPVVDDDAISDEERADIGDLGNDEDDAGGIEGLLRELASGPPTRMGYLMHRVAQSLQALRDLRSGPASAWPQNRVAEEHWRFVADKALGLVATAARREIGQQKLIAELPESRRESFQQLSDSQLGLRVFSKGFEAERKAWEQAYWKRALDESFGKRPWAGPSGWRAQQ